MTTRKSRSDYCASLVVEGRTAATLGDPRMTWLAHCPGHHQDHERLPRTSYPPPWPKVQCPESAAPSAAETACQWRRSTPTPAATRPETGRSGAPSPAPRTPSCRRTQIPIHRRRSFALPEGMQPVFNEATVTYRRIVAGVTFAWGDPDQHVAQVEDHS